MSVPVCGLAGFTVTVTLFDTVPPLPVHEREYVVVSDGVTLSFPEVFFAPLHPPDAVQEEAFEVLHSSSDESPSVIVEGVAVKVSVGSDGPPPHRLGGINWIGNRLPSFA
jgi:hypothetical protein